jgi:hypothetical protein
VSSNDVAPFSLAVGHAYPPQTSLLINLVGILQEWQKCRIQISTMEEDTINHGDETAGRIVIAETTQ